MLVWPHKRIRNARGWSFPYLQAPRALPLPLMENQNENSLLLITKP